MANKKAIITTEYKKGQKGFVFMESIDKESGRPYTYIELESGKIEVFFEGEFELV